MRLRHFARETEEHGEGEFRRGDRVTSRRVHYDDAALRGSFYIHVVNADSGATDDAELGRGFENLLGNLGFRTDNHRHGIRYDGEQFRLSETFGENHDLEFGSLLQQGDAFRRNRITNQNLHKTRRRV